MSLCLPFSMRVPACMLIIFIGISEQSVLASESPVLPEASVHFNSVSPRFSFNSLSSKDRRDITIKQENGETQEKPSRGWTRDWRRSCETLNQQLKGAVQREPIIKPDFYPYADLSRTYPDVPYGQRNGARPDNSLRNSSEDAPRTERRELEMRYYAACNK